VINADEFAFLIGRIVEEMLQHPEVPVYIGCWGGIGRTGTVFAGLVRAPGVDEVSPAAWARESYLYNAVETGAQKDLIKEFDVSDVQRLISPPVEEPVRNSSFFARLKAHFFRLERNLFANAVTQLQPPCIEQTKEGHDRCHLATHATASPIT
jgi:hypothetical protein